MKKRENEETRHPITSQYYMCKEGYGHFDVDKEGNKRRDEVRENRGRLREMKDTMCLALEINGYGKEVDEVRLWEEERFLFLE